jgi:quinoprotein glucose dehydrogenase
VDPIKGELYIVSKNLPVMLHAELSNEEPSARTIVGSVVTPQQAADALAAAKAAAAKGPVRYVVPYDFLRSPTTGMSAIKPPWSHITAYDLNTGEIKWRIPDGTTVGPGIPPDSGAHFPRGSPLVTAGGLLFVATAQDRMLRAYDRDNGKVLWAKALPSGSEGIPATYEVGGRQYLAVPVAAGAGLFAPTLDVAGAASPSAAAGAAAGGAAAASAAAAAASQDQRGYMVFALPRG